MPDQDSTAPSRETLAKLFKDLPRMVVTQNNKVAPKHAHMANSFRQFCPVCAKHHDMVYRDTREAMKVGNCPDCQKMFDEGFYAAVCVMDDGKKRIAFLKPTNNRCQDLVGKMVKVGIPVMEKIIELQKQNEKSNPKNS